MSDQEVPDPQEAVDLRAYWMENFGYEPEHQTEVNTLLHEQGLAESDVSLCLPGWIKSFCEKFETGKGWILTHGQVNAIAHTLIAARKRQHRLIRERDRARSSRIAASVVRGFNELRNALKSGLRLPSQEEHPTGLNRKYVVTKADGSESDPNNIYFVLLLNGKNPAHTRACRAAAKAWIASIDEQLKEESREVLPLRHVADDLEQLLHSLENAPPKKQEVPPQ